jgi:hypothetical protein
MTQLFFHHNPVLNMKGFTFDGRNPKAVRSITDRLKKAYVNDGDSSVLGSATEPKKSPAPATPRKRKATTDKPGSSTKRAKKSPEVPSEAEQSDDEAMVKPEAKEEAESDEEY